jgi:signal transduction histidine kinase
MAMRKQQRQKPRYFPTGVFLIAIGIVCAGMGASEIYSFFMFSHLRDQYLEKLGHDVASAADLQTRGPERRYNLNLWQSVLDESFNANRDHIAFLLLYEASGQTLASAGEYAREELSAPARQVSFQNESIYIFDEHVPTPQYVSHPPPGAGWRIRIGLYTSSAAFIMKQAYTQIAVSIIVISTIAGLAFYFLRTLRRFIEFKSRHEAERHLASLGKLSTTLAHEIRNPLGAMKGLTQIAQEKLSEDHDMQPLLQTVVSEAERLERLVGDLLGFARPHNLQISRFDLNLLIREVTEILHSGFDAAGVTLDTKTGPGNILIRSDENGLRQVLLNVLINAVDATPRGGSVTVSAKRASGAQQVSIQVEDTGAGIGGRDPEELFQPFITTKESGSGLGLAISRQIIERLGGRITLSNGQAAGARCAITLPLQCRG